MRCRCLVPVLSPLSSILLLTLALGSRSVLHAAPNFLVIMLDDLDVRLNSSSRGYLPNTYKFIADQGITFNNMVGGGGEPGPGQWLGFNDSWWWTLGRVYRCGAFEWCALSVEEKWGCLSFWRRRAVMQMTVSSAAI